MRRPHLLSVAVALSLLTPLGSSGVLRLPDATPSGASDLSFPLQASLRTSDAQAGDKLGWSVAVWGNVAIVGAVGEDGGGGDPMVNAGAAYVFQRNRDGAAQWGQVQKLTAPDAQVRDQFGTSVAISGDTAVIGAAEEDGGPGDPESSAGAAYVFQNLGGFNWLHVKTLRASDFQLLDRFGSSVAISGDTVLVGAPYEKGGVGDPLPNAGAAYVFGRNQNGPNEWGEVEQLRASDPGSSDLFGASVAISGNLAVVGAYEEDGGPGDPFSGAGAAYVFQNLPGFGWTHIKKLTATDASADKSYGSSVAISGGVILVGADGDHGAPNSPMPSAGAAYIHLRHLGGSNVWGQAKKLTAPDAQTGD